MLIIFLKKKDRNRKYVYYNNPIDPAVKPIIRKNENSARSLGRELTIILN